MTCPICKSEITKTKKGKCGGLDLVCDCGVEWCCELRMYMKLGNIFNSETTPAIKETINSNLKQISIF